MWKPAVILVSPKGGENVGGVARLMGNFGLTELRIIEPRCDLASIEVKSRSLEGFAIIESAKVYSNLEEAQADLFFTAAVSMRSAGPRPPANYLHELGPAFFCHRSQPWAFVFGREDNGLEAHELRLCSHQIQILSSEEMPSLNLTSATGIVLHEWFLKSQSESLPRVEPYSSRPAKEQEEIFFHQVKRLLVDVNFLKHPDHVHIMSDLRDVYHRADPTDRELRILFGMVSDLSRELGLRKEKSPDIE